MNIKGKLIHKSEEVQITQSFKKREFVIQFADNPEYPEVIKFELIQDKCSLLDGLVKGQEIDVYFNLKGRCWTDGSGVEKYFNSLQAWKIEAGQAPSNAEKEEEEDDLPF